MIGAFLLAFESSKRFRKRLKIFGKRYDLSFVVVAMKLGAFAPFGRADKCYYCSSSCEIATVMPGRSSLRVLTLAPHCYA